MDGHIVLRVSRCLNMHTKEFPQDAKIIIRWLRSKPVGVTQLGSEDSPLTGELEEGSGDSDTWPPSGIAVCD